MFTINRLQNTAARTAGGVHISDSGKTRGTGALATLRRGVRRILRRVGLMRTGQTQARRQKRSAENLLRALEMRFNPRDLEAAGLTRDNLEATGGMRGTKLAGDLESVHHKEAERVAGKREMARDLRNLSPSSRRDELPPALKNALPKDYDQWSAQRKSSFAGIYRRTFDMHLEAAIRFDRETSPCDAARMDKIAKAAAQIAVKETSSPTEAARNQAAWDNFNGAVNQYLDALTTGESGEHFEMLQHQLALKHHVLSARVLPPEHQKELGFSEARMAPMIMAIRSAKSELASENPAYVADLSEGVAKNVNKWAPPMLASAYLRLQDDMQQNSEVLREATGSHLVVDMLWMLSADEDVGSDLSLPPWVSALQPGGILSSFEYDREVLPVLNVDRDAFNESVGRARAFVDRVNAEGIEEYMSEGLRTDV
ncbi:MAG: hypothetical protein MPK06_04680 [Alphaproteobacteria bacterium]|nr:hypothetical protein [Alphaproteobacteria bacterium]MDA8004459.1 hypothetical protein [Alphaproteobacteria bacterium]MDA8005816.1 hypothetical protein [Alphaproteobacteria bacterium]MDA8013781.1 hypothetical protein [Alphaproteobacteria bacterium]